jgi:hypothetical protein
LETLELVRTSDPIAPSGLVPKIPRDAEAVCLKCRSKDPGKRYQSAEALEVGEEVVAALDAFTAAVEAYDDLGYRKEEFVAAAFSDDDRLLCRKLACYPELGEPIDPSPGGPLGRL